ncbi:MAG: PQQ-like beta-propeller repeat protein [Proteobacteria bacterium]|nr:PQQ-like beta-propeller repeat protein [Pseudomonadota bacterium]
MKMSFTKIQAALFVIFFFASGWAFAAGELVWQAPFGVDGYTWSTPVVVDNYVFLQDQEGGIGCYETSDGSKVWYKSFGMTISVTSPVFKGGKLYVFAASNLYCIDPEDGSILGQFSADNGINSQAPAVSDDLIFFSTYSTLYAVNLADLTEAWRVTVGSTANIIVDDNIIYALADKLYALNPADGSVYWQEGPTLGDGFYIGALKDDYLVCFTTMDSATAKSNLVNYQLNATRILSPTMTWSAEFLNSADNSPPAICNTNVYATSREGVLRAYALAGDGTPIWERTVRSSGMASALPIALDGKVFIQEENAGTYSLVCLNSTTGTVVWQTSAAGMGVSWSQPVLKDNAVYLATDHENGLFAFDAGTVNGNWYMMKHNPALTGYNNGYEPEIGSSTDDSSDDASDSSDEKKGEDDGGGGGCFIRSLFMK